MRYLKRLRKNWVLILIFVFAIIILILAPFVYFSALKWTEESEAVGKGAVGDFFNGMIGPFIASVGAVLTFAAFYVQFQANESQKKSIKKQDKKIAKQGKEIRKDRFEQRFFEMLKIHRENAANMSFSTWSGFSASGKEALALIVFEIELTYMIFKKIPIESINGAAPREQLRLATLFVNWGVGKELSNEDLASRMHLSNPLNERELKILQEFRQGVYGGMKNATDTANADLFMGQVHDKFNRGPLISYFSQNPGGHALWRGQKTQVSPYLRHLNRMMETLSKESGDGKKDVISNADAKFYSNLLRSQMTSDEQKLLFYLSITNIGDYWWEKETMHRFAPFKNISIDDAPEGFDFVEVTRMLLSEYPKNSLRLSEEIKDMSFYFDDVDLLVKTH